MEAVFNDEEVVYSYTRREAIEDGIIVDVTEYIKSLNIKLNFDSVFFTTTLFEHITGLETPKGIQTILDLLDFGKRVEYNVEVIQHFHLPKGRMLIKSSEEYSRYVLECCYASEE